MRKFAILLVLIALIVSMTGTVQAAPPPDGPPGLERAIEVQEAYTDRLMGVPGVVGTAVGLTPDGRAAVKILTERVGVAGLPSSLNNIPVEVVVTGKFIAREDPTARQDRPVPIGVSIGHPDITAGTIGARVKDSSGYVYALSNNHVLACENEAAIGDAVIQPGTYDGGALPKDEIGTLWDFEPIDFGSGTNVMDAAIALSSEGLLDNKTLPISGYGVPGAYDPDLEVKVGLPVQKYGRTTGLTHGTVDAINATVTVCYEALYGIFCLKSATFVGQIIITPGDFSDGGDSGSLIVTDDDNKNAVGLLFAGSKRYTIANQIGPVLDRFNVVIDSEPGDAPPTINIVSPTGGSKVFDIVTVEANATDDHNVEQVEFLVDTTSIDIDTDGSNGWSVAWDTAEYSEGEHTITATATDTVGQTNSDSIVVTVDNVNDQPVASFTYTCSGLTCYFDASGSSDPDGDIISYAWTFGDGENESGATPTYTYNAAGTYDVTLTVTDDDGAPGMKTQQVTVSDAVATMHVGDLDASKTIKGKSGKWSAAVTVTIHDNNCVSVSGAEVVGWWTYEWGGQGDIIEVIGLTGYDGTVTFSIDNGDIGKVIPNPLIFTVMNVNHNLFTYEPTDNHDPDPDYIDGYNIIVHWVE